MHIQLAETRKRGRTLPKQIETGLHTDLRDAAQARQGTEAQAAPPGFNIHIQRQEHRAPAWLVVEDQVSMGSFELG